MSKTVDDLVKVYIIAHFGADNGPRNRERYRAGIAAVVRAVRDEIVEGGNCKYCVATTAMYNEILGDAGSEKVAGGSTREDEKAVEAAGDKGPVTVNSPATTPAPAVCEWTKRKYEPGFYATPHGIKFKDRRYDNCGICGREIKFTEAKT